MKYVLDASVAVAALREGEPHHGAALRRCMPLFEGIDEVVVPAIFDTEVVSALARRGARFSDIERLFGAHLFSRRLVTIGPRSARAASRIAAATRLRAAYALYVWVAAREGLTLVTLDRDVLERGASACAVEPA